MQVNRVGAWQSRRSGYGPGLFIFLLGMGLGLLGATETGLGERTDLLNFLAGALAAKGLGAAASPGTVAALWRGLGAAAMNYLAALSVIGLPVLFLQLGVRGFAYGFSLAFLWQQFGWRGFWPGAVTLAATGGLAVTALLIFTAAGWRLALTLLRAQFGGHLGLRRRGVQDFHRLAAVAALLGIAASLLTARLAPWGLDRLGPLFR